MPQELPNDLRLRILGNWEISGKSQNFIELLPSAQSSSRNESFVSTSKNSLKNRKLTLLLFHTKTRVCLEYFVNDCRRKKSAISFNVIKKQGETLAQRSSKRLR